MDHELPENDVAAFPFAGPGFSVALLSVYLLIVLKVGKSYMEHRKPYNMKTFMIVYNIYQLIGCCYLIKLVLDDELVPMNRIFENCLGVHSLNTSQDLYFFAAFSYWLKVSEMCETFVFILRKKYNQVTFLHVFHHCATVTLIFMGGWTGHTRGSYLALFINSIVHIVMYAYYLAAAVFSERAMKKLTPIKKSITTLQMIQFAIILIHIAIQRVYYKCAYNDYVIIVFAFLVGVIFYSFYDFYQKAYKSKGSKKSSHRSKSVRGH